MSIDFIEYLFQKNKTAPNTGTVLVATHEWRGIRQAMPRRRGASGQNT